MKLWSLHPSYLDIQGLHTVWQEGLLGMMIMENQDAGFQNDPQLIRFWLSGDPMGILGFYLSEIYNEAKNRGFNFDDYKLQKINNSLTISVNSGQIDYEALELMNILQKRDKEKFRELNQIFQQKSVKTHPLFYIIEGPVEKWEIF
jgi:hypothetical protein